jgi:hypothetical protein
MKKTITFALSLMFLAVSFASAPSNPKPGPLNAAQIMIPLGKDGRKISLLELSRISKTELETITGRKMNGVQSLAFKGAQKKMKKGINSEGIVTGKKMKKLFYAGDEGFHLGGFALGFLVGLIGVLIAYLINDDYKQNRVKWSWIGFGVALVLYLVIILAAV